jgi:flagellin
MSIVVNTNVASLLVQRSLTKASDEIGKSLEKLSTGCRINRASDDAAGLSISESLRSQARGSAMASQNAQTGMNLLQTAEADLGIIQENLQRIRDLSIQAANGTNGTSERNAIKSEVQERVREITRIAKSSSFSSVKLLNGDNTTMTLQVGANFVANAVSLNSLNIGSPLQRADSTSLGLNSATGDFLADQFATAMKAASFLTTIDAAISLVTGRRSTIGSLQNRLETTIQSLAVKQQNMTASESRIRDTDVAKEAANLTKNQILQQASTSLLAQANQAPSIALKLLG